MDSGDIKSLEAALKNFRQEVHQAASEIGEPKTASLPRFFIDIKASPGRVLEIDGDWLLDSFYQHPERREKTHTALEKLNQLKLGIRSLVKTVNQKQDQGDQACQVSEPAKYLALLTADGDSMGELLAGCKKNQHPQISSFLNTFATAIAPKVLVQDRPGFILFWGGDEGLALLSLADLLGAMQDLRDRWHKEIGTLKSSGLEHLPTLSAGAVIFHHQYPLRQAIREVYETLEHAKGLRSDNREKDAWSVKILKRSGAPLLTRGHWDYPDGDTMLQPLEVLKRFVELYQHDRLSPRWLAALDAEAKALGDPPASWPDQAKKEWCLKAQGLFNHEAKRLIFRQAVKSGDRKENKELEDLVEQIQKLNDNLTGIGATINFSRHRDLRDMLHVSNYIAKGGGR